VSIWGVVSGIQIQDTPVVSKKTKGLNNGGYDKLGASQFAGFGYVATPDNVIRCLLQACYNWDDLPGNFKGSWQRDHQNGTRIQPSGRLCRQG
jgi:hypothetical protein